MANVTVTFTITEFCLHTGISEVELNEIVGLGVVEPREIQETTWVFDDHAAIVVQRAVRLRHELALDWPGIAVALTLMDDIAHLKQENRLLRQRLSRMGTIDLRVDYLRPGRGERFTATSTLLRAGNKVAVARVELHNEAQVYIASATATYMVG